MDTQVSVLLSIPQNKIWVFHSMAIEFDCEGSIQSHTPHPDTHFSLWAASTDVSEVQVDFPPFRQFLTGVFHPPFHDLKGPLSKPANLQLPTLKLSPTSATYPHTSDKFADLSYNTGHQASCKTLHATSNVGGSTTTARVLPRTQFLQLHLAYLYRLLSQYLSPKSHPTICAPSFISHTGCHATLRETYYIKRCLGEQVSDNALPDKEREVSDNCHLANGTVML